jgi:hypothetical protein
MSTWTQSHGETGAFASIQRASLPQRVVELSAAGAERLGDLYSPASPVRSSKDSDIRPSCETIVFASWCRSS